MKKILAMIVSVALVATLAISGTVAYLQDSDSAVNVMTLGNVYIEQIELERIDASESAASNKDNFRTFTQGQMLLPATGTDEYGNIPYAVDKNGNDVLQQLPYGGAMQLWDDDGGNVMDKLVFVKNTGKTDAYVRTLIAYEGTSMGGDTDDLIHPVYNGTFWDAETIGTIEVDGVNYTLAEYTYKRDDGAGAGVLKPGETTRPSLLQLYMASWAGNEDMTQFGDTYDILVVSQAVQAAGFADAKTALDTAFGDVTAANNPWITTDEDGNVSVNSPITRVATQEEFNAAVANAEAGDTILLGNGEFVLNGNMKEGVTYIGSGNTVVSNPSGNALGGTLKDVTIANMKLDGNNGLRNCYGNGTVTLDNCTIEGDVYGVHFDGGSGKVIVRNSDITGWNSFGRTLESVTFDNCTFNKGGYGTLRFYQNAVVNNCTFSKDFSWIDSAVDNITINITNSKWEDHESVTGLLYNNGEFENVKWIVDGTEVTTVTTHPET